ncbi:NAD(P)-dependent oxidoreductase [Desulfovibrio sp. OttesenSCG-928-M16]|nr:NAD(P)-dependent oxidoreductase [Desulfovibrio sp. OttesenSCG-928-M16]
MKAALLTGCTGEIGNALVRLLLAQGTKVYALCRPNSWRLRHLPTALDLQVIERDIFDLPGAEKDIPAPCDACFHLGWHASYGEERNDAYGQVRNITATLDAVHLAARLGCQVFVGAGSQAQYGDTDEILTEDTPMRPTNAYGAAKLCAEQMSRELCAALGPRHVWGRVASVYGPCDGPYTLISYLMRTQLEGKEALLTPCEQLWDYLYADDAARAFLALAQKGRDGHAYCIASGSSRPLRDYIADFRALLGERARLTIGGKAYAPNHRMRLAVDITKLCEDTDFAPQVGFADGIARTWRWYGEQTTPFDTHPNT